MVISEDGAPLVSAIIGSLNGALIAVGIGGIEIFWLRGGSSFAKSLLRLPLIAIVALKTLAYAPIVTILPALHLLMSAELLSKSPVDLRTELITVAF